MTVFNYLESDAIVTLTCDLIWDIHGGDILANQGLSFFIIFGREFAIVDLMPVGLLIKAFTKRLGCYCNKNTSIHQVKAFAIHVVERDVDLTPARGDKLGGSPHSQVLDAF